MPGQIALLRSRRLFPMLGTQVSTAFNDNLIKSTLLLLVTYGGFPHGGLGPELLGPLAGATLIAPYLVLSGLAGEWADRYDRARLLRWLKLAELGLIGLAATTLLLGSAPMALLVMALLGTQATLTSPIRYALLPQHLSAAELVDGNALMEGATFLAILLGTLGGGLAVSGAQGTLLVSSVLILVSVLGVIASRFVPAAPAPVPDLRIDLNPLRSSWLVLRSTARLSRVQRASLAISWFWAAGATYLAEFPAWARGDLGAGSSVVTLFLAAFSIGIALGSSGCGRLLQGHISAGPVGWAGSMMALASGLIWFLGRGPAPDDGHLVGLIEWLSRPNGVALFLALLGFGIAGGFFVVPLYAIMQAESPPDHRARVIAANNILTAMLIIASALVSGVLVSQGVSIPVLFLGVGVITLGEGWAARRHLAESRRPRAKPEPR